MAGNEPVAKWIANKLRDDGDFSAIDHVGAGFLEITREGSPAFTAAAIGVDDVVRREHVAPLFDVQDMRPEFVVNVPSKAIWEGEAIRFVHNAPAAFGTMGDLVRASRYEPISSYRNKQYNFFEQAFRQHGAVDSITRLYDRLFQLHRRRGLSDVVVVLIDTYDMSAEDVRHARDLYGHFDVALKMTSYGSITTAARKAAQSIDAEAFKLGELMGRLNKR